MHVNTTVETARSGRTVDKWRCRLLTGRLLRKEGAKSGCRRCDPVLLVTDSIVQDWQSHAFTSPSVANVVVMLKITDDYNSVSVDHAESR